MERQTNIRKVQYLNETILLISQEGHWKHWWRNGEFEFGDGQLYPNQEEALNQIKLVIDKVTAVRALSSILEEWLQLGDISKSEMFNAKISLMGFLPLD